MFKKKVRVYYYSSYSLSLRCLGRTGVPCPPLRGLSGVSSLFFSGCAVLWRVMWFGVGGVRGCGCGVLVYGGGPCSYLNRASPAPSPHCGLCTLILCAGTRDPLMHRWVARTIVMATLLVTYPHVCE